MGNRRFSRDSRRTNPTCRRSGRPPIVGDRRRSAARSSDLRRGCPPSPAHWTVVRSPSSGWVGRRPYQPVHPPIEIDSSRTRRTTSRTSRLPDRHRGPVSGDLPTAVSSIRTADGPLDHVRSRTRWRVLYRYRPIAKRGRGPIRWPVPRSPARIPGQIHRAGDVDSAAPRRIHQPDGRPVGPVQPSVRLDSTSPASPSERHFVSRYMIYTSVFSWRPRRPPVVDSTVHGAQRL